MKQTTILVLLGLSMAAILPAQPLYILYDATCMNLLEYRYVYTGATAMSYSMQPSASEQFQLQAGTPGINSPTLPAGTVRCREYNFNEAFLNAVNNLTKQVYIVHQQTQGYILVPIISAAQVIRSGNYYLVKARNYSFAVDTSNLVYESNIATGSSDWYIYFNGLKIRGCYYEYSFKREPTRANQERSEFDFIPGIGLSTERSGMTASDAENNQYRLVKVNNVALEDYIVAQCQGKAVPATAPVSQYTPKVDYGVVREGDKETASMAKPNTNQPPAGLPPLADCPEPPGEGYHIVQPKETMNMIARAYGIPVKMLISWNKIKDPDRVSSCQKIWLRKPPTEAPAAAVSAKQPQAATTSKGAVAIRQEPYWQKNQQPQPQPQQPQQPQQAVKTPDVQQPTAYSIMQPNTQPQPTYTPAGQTLVHTVQQGETLFGIGQKYRVTEADMRRFNKYPPTGPVNIQPGMQLFVGDCCPGQPAQPTQSSQPQTQPGWTNPGNNPAPGTLPDMFSTPGSPQPTAPATYSQPGTTAPTTTTSAATYFQEYIVREGDTINSIAVRFKASPQEIALVNNKDQNETLVAGQRLLIPRS
ncbi:MAG: LysM peptidoglycan-binding domain-containing protein [Saprospiraceae bacterium]